MKKTFLIIFLFLILLSGFFYFLVKNDFSFVSEKYSFEASGEDFFYTDITIFDSQYNIVRELNIEDFNNLLKENWDKFLDKPMVAIRDIEPGAFNYFDNNIYISKNLLFFSVHDYAALTTESIVGFMNIKTGEIKFFPETFRGDLSNFKAYNKNKNLLFVNNTARSEADYLTILDIENLKLQKILTEDDLKTMIGIDIQDFYIPNFNHISIDDDFIYFYTDYLKENETIKWKMNYYGENIEIIR